MADPTPCPHCGDRVKAGYYCTECGLISHDEEDG